MEETWVHSMVGKIPWRREWLPTPVFLPGEFHGQRSLVGYSPWSHKESGMTKQLNNNKKLNIILKILWSFEFLLFKLTTSVFCSYFHRHIYVFQSFVCHILQIFHFVDVFELVVS